MANYDKDDSKFRKLKKISAMVGESSKIGIDSVIKRFQSNHELQDFTFSNKLTSQERAYIHAQAGFLGLKSNSTGKDPNRRITISKPMGNNRQVLGTVELSSRSVVEIQDLNTPSIVLPEGEDISAWERPPEVISEKQFQERDRYPSERSAFTNRLFTEPCPKVPKAPLKLPYDSARHKLPIWNMKQTILETINNNPVTFIRGDTGCGKTTQVPQFILDNATRTKQCVRIICTVPRRIAAVSISDRVSTERGERVGGTVGYQIRLESCISPCDTLLTYCTSGVLLRSLTTFDYSILKKTTHIIVDEVHERDRQTEFLLACLRDLGREFPNLKLVLMGADMDTQLLTSYFSIGASPCPIIEVHGRLHPVETLFLEDILSLLEYEKDPQFRKPFWPHQSSENYSLRRLGDNFKMFNIDEDEQATVCPKLNNLQKAANSRIYGLDEKIQQVWQGGDVSTVKDFIALASKNLIDVNHKNSESQVTMLMACAVHGITECLLQLLELGADSSISVVVPGYQRPFTAEDWARDHQHSDCEKAIQDHEFNACFSSVQREPILPEIKERLQRYQKSIDEDRVDLILVIKLIYRIHLTTSSDEAILVFLPGYDDIVTLKQMIFMDSELGTFSGDIVVFLLHSNIQTGDQRAVFDRPRNGKRKIVLSTNIAETSLTIEDIVHVIDSGKVKEKSFDSMTGVTQLRSNWISKASANQRQGRGGRCRPGTCYRLYSTARFENMSEFPIAEIVRSSLQELCLYTRAFIRNDLNIRDFFKNLPEPPAPIAVNKSLASLKAMGALDQFEQLTKLGMYLLDLPIEPFLGKALMYSVTLKCVDPILTIVALISHREPFQLPSSANDKKKALDSKYQFSEDSLSDHLACLKSFLEWEKSLLFKESVQRRFCADRFLSAACFEMVYGIRAQLLGQLRASGFIQSTGTSDLKDLNINSYNWPLVKGILTACLYPNVCYIDRENNCLYNEFDSKIKFHQNSVVLMNQKKAKDAISNLPTNWVVFDEMCQHEFVRLVRSATVISEVSLAVFGGDFKQIPVVYDGGLSAGGRDDPDNPQALMVEPSSRFELNNWISFRGSKLVIKCVIDLRVRFRELVTKRLHYPSVRFTDTEEAVLQTIANVMMYEDEERGFLKVEGIGQWPKLVSGNMMSTPRTGFNRSQAISNDEGQAMLQ